jgi:dihydrofolate reductase
MSELRCFMSMSLDGYVAGPNQSAGMLDEIDISVVPIFLRAGERLFENLGPEPPQLEQVNAIDAPGVTHLRYRTVE